MSGLAQHFCDHELCGDYSNEYACGLWQRDIFRGLLWMTLDNTIATRPTKYLAPSWSWAAIRGQIQWPSRDTERHCRNDIAAKLVNCVAPLVNGRMEAAQPGRLTIRAKLRAHIQLVAPSEPGALLRFPSNVLHEGLVIGNGLLDARNDEISLDDWWLVQIQTQMPLDSFIPYHPTMLILRKNPASSSEYHRYGCATLDEDSLGFFDQCKHEELTLL